MKRSKIVKAKYIFAKGTDYFVFFAYLCKLDLMGIRFVIHPLKDRLKISASFHSNSERKSFEKETKGEWNNPFDSDKFKKGIVILLNPGVSWL